MKNQRLIHVTVSLIIVLFVSRATQSQTVDKGPWCPKGANWVYSSLNIYGGLFYKFSYNKDSVIHTKPVKVLKVYQILYNGMTPDDYSKTIKEVGQEYLYASNDSVFWFDKVNDRFSFIYSFHPTVGDIWVVGNSRAYCLYGKPYSPTTDTITVNAKDTTTFGNFAFETFETSKSGCFYLGTIIANIGPRDCPFPEINYDKCGFDLEGADLTPTAEYGNVYGSLLCYSDSLRGRIQFKTSTLYDCDDIVLGYEDDFYSKVHEIALYPNPAIGTICINNSQNKAITHVSIVSSTGSLAFEGDFHNNETRIDISYLLPGIYSVNVLDDENHPTILKFIKSQE